MKDKATVKYSFKVTIPIMASFLAIGAAFGVLLESKGYGWWWAALMSIGIYAGSMQFVVINLITSGASLVTAAVMTLMVNLRHLFYGIAMLEKYKNIGRVRPYVIYALPDETFSLVCSPDLPDDVDEKKYCFLVSLFNQIYWVAGSIIGGIIGSAITFDTAGIDFAMTALFTVIFVEHWEKTKQHLPAVTGLGISVISLLIFGPGSFLIPAMAGITALLLIEKRWITKEETDDR